ncbi:MAG TPA: AsmA family protein [Thermodesulfobacteriota bacterium]|nr:AsmA family protein [Thermodesulfobacteriota bacterium]
MKKFLKAAAIVVGILVLLVIGLSIAVKSYLSSDRLKPIILPRAEAMTGRKVQLDEINVSLFSGITASGLTVKEKDGQADFLKIGKFVLSYELLPLLKRQLVISKIEIVSPSISVKKERGGRYNFSDMMGKPSQETQKPSGPEHPSQHKSLPISVVADRLLIRDARLTFVDETKGLPDISLALDGEFKGSLQEDGTPRMDFGLLSIKGLQAKLKDREIKVSGKVDMDAQTLRANLQTVIGKDNLQLSAMAKNYRSTPDIVADIHAQTLDLQQLMGLGGEKKGKEQEGAPQKGSKGEAKAEPSGVGTTEKIKASGLITVDKATYQNYTFKELHLRYQYANGALKVDPLGLQFSGEGSFSSEGSLDGQLQCAVERTSGIQKTLRGTAVAKLGKGAIKQSQIFDAIASLTGIASLKNPGFDQGLFNFDMKDERLMLDGWISSALFKISPKGVVDFDKRLDIPTELKLSPSLTGNLKGRLAAIKVFDDEQGWKIIPLRIKGTTDHPSVTLDEEGLSKQLGRGLKREIERRLFERTPEEPGKPSKKTKAKDILKDLLRE